MAAETMLAPRPRGHSRLSDLLREPFNRLRGEVDISVKGDMLILKGEKKEEREEKERDYTISERSYGAFERRIALPADSDAEGLEASSDNGVIAIDIQRTKSAPEKGRKIEISSRS
ncbi:MAG: Hsp20/alpha crystallin family protein [Erythrobacter sp.]